MTTVMLQMLQKTELLNNYNFDEKPVLRSDITGITVYFSFTEMFRERYFLLHNCNVIVVSNMVS